MIEQLEHALHYASQRRQLETATTRTENDIFVTVPRNARAGVLHLGNWEVGVETASARKPILEKNHDMKIDVRTRKFSASEHESKREEK